ncbi:Dihydroorotate dehydrogenase B (NAD(+)), catalytic subunit [Thalassoglobus neptunius]|uniref:Dihydroorotate dehydrogenase B (NAD(+)), catalytic subunit n=1 Tax=Thalassoglobus neptunius TaxID=1938619 RepID=A0A5C5WPC9_9PLAN|nr:hypothetical protein [Thalassoglobus neptunius]TWT52280.1 Dihydroorotate dehydrogenase B (NAD(+)), catalytic subunit [Thalassoglobus neptunius]
MNPSESPQRKFQIDQSYDWNFAHAPQTAESSPVAKLPGDWTFCGKAVNSPLGIAAGPLLNGNWVRYYASLGFDVLTYKTVRSGVRECYPLPNLVPVSSEMMNGTEQVTPTASEMDGTWAVSFGMPSKEPEFWKNDIRETKQSLGSGQLLSVSVVGTMQDGWGIDELGADYAQCAFWAVESGADCVEMNFSCPNVCSEDGQLFQNPTEAATVAEAVRKRIGADVPLLVKIGFLPDNELLAELLLKVGEFVNAFVSTNSLPTQVSREEGDLLFSGASRGICGRAIRDASVDQIRRCRTVVETHGLPVELVGVGGIETAADVRQYLDAGANSVQLATAAMVNPEVGLQIRSDWS